LSPMKPAIYGEARRLPLYLELRCRSMSYGPLPPSPHSRNAMQPPHGSKPQQGDGVGWLIRFYHIDIHTYSFQWPPFLAAFSLIYPFHI
jgi:hypothetical protein